MGDAAGGWRDEAAGDTECGVTDEERGIEDHEVFDFAVECCGSKRDNASKQEGREGGFDDPAGEESNDGASACSGTFLEEPTECDVATIEGSKQASTNEETVSAEGPWEVSGLRKEDAQDVVVAEEPGCESFAEEGVTTGGEGPESECSVEEKEEEKLERTDGVSGSDGAAFAVHLDSALPLLEVEPGAEEETYEDGDEVTPKGQLANEIGGTGRVKKAVPVAGFAGKADEDEDDSEEDAEEDCAVAPFDAADGEFFAEEDACHDSDKHGEGEVKEVGFQA